MSCKQIANQWKKLIVFLLLVVFFIPNTASAAEDSKVSGYITVGGKRFELTSAAAYPLNDDIAILITDKAIPKGRAKAFVQRYLDGTGLKGIAVALKPPDGNAAGAPTLVYAMYFGGDGRGSYDTRPSSHFFLDGVTGLPNQLDGRFHGVVVYTPEEIAVDVSFKVPVKEPPAPKPLPKDGGEPGKAFLRVLEALRGKNVQAVKKLCCAEVRNFLMDEKESSENFVNYLVKTYVGTEVKIISGTRDVDRAVLKIEVTKNKQTKSKKAKMELESDGWKLGQ